MLELYYEDDFGIRDWNPANSFPGGAGTTYERMVEYFHSRSYRGGVTGVRERDGEGNIIRETVRKQCLDPVSGMTGPRRTRLPDPAVQGTRLHRVRDRTKRRPPVGGRAR